MAFTTNRCCWHVPAWSSTRSAVRLCTAWYSCLPAWPISWWFWCRSPCKKHRGFVPGSVGGGQFLIGDSCDSIRNIAGDEPSGGGRRAEPGACGLFCVATSQPAQSVLIGEQCPRRTLTPSSCSGCSLDANACAYCRHPREQLSHLQ